MRAFTRRALLSVPMLLPAASAMAVGTWRPSRTVTCTIPFTAGGGTDAVFRHVKDHAARQNITMVAEYRPGAEGLIGMRAGAAAPADGHSLTFGTIGTMSHLSDGWGAAESHRLITGLRGGLFFLVTGANSGIGSLDELVARLRSGEPRITGGSGAPGQRVAMESFLRGAGISGAVIASYRGAAGVVQDIAGNHIQWGMIPGNVVAGQIAGGQLRLLATDRRTGDRDLTPGVPSIFDIVPEQGRPDGQLVALPLGTPDAAFAFWRSFFMAYSSLPETQADIDREFSISMPFGDEFLLERIRNWRTNVAPTIQG